MDVEHQEFLEELLQVLTEDSGEEKTPEEIMGEVVSIVDDYKSELELAESEQEERDKLTMMGIDPDEEVEQPEENDSDSEEDDDAIINKPLNRAFLLTKAQKEYYKKRGLTAQDIDDFSPSEKIKHRKGVTALFNEMVVAEQEKPTSPSKYTNGPFKKIAGNVNVNRKPAEDEEDNSESLFDEDEVTPAEIRWKRSQTKDIRTKIKSVEVEIDELKRQNKIKKISPSIVNRNNERIAELEEELEELEEQRSQYK